MKVRFLNLFLVLSLIISVFSFPVITSAAESYPCSQDVMDYEIFGSTLNVTAKITNSTGSKMMVTGYCAVYNASGVQKGLNSCTVMVGVSSPATIIYSIENYIFEADDYIKAFLWDDNFTPIGEAVTENIVFGEEIEGIVVGTYLSNSYYDGGNTAEIVVTKSSGDIYRVGEKYEFMADKVDVHNLLGYKVTAIVGADDNATKEILDISEKSGVNNTLTLDTDLIWNLTPESIEYFESASATRATTAEIQPYVQSETGNFDISDKYIVINDLNDSRYVQNFDIFNTYYKLDDITLLDNDNDGAFEFIFAQIPTDYAVDFVAEDVDYEERFITGMDYETIDLGNNSPTKHATIIRDGKIVDFSEIVKGDTVTCLDIGVDNLTIYVSSVSVTGTVDEIDGDVYLIGNKKYQLSGIANAVSLSAGDNGTFYINAFGKIAYADLITPFDTAEYMYIIDAAYDRYDFEDEYLIKAVTAAGEVKVFNIKHRKVSISENGLTQEDLSNYEAYNILSDYAGLAKITITDAGEISAFYLPDCNDEFVSNSNYEKDAEYQTHSYKADRCTYGRVELSPDTIIFNVDTAKTNLEEAIKTSTVGDLFNDGVSYSFIAYGAYGDVADVLVTFDVDKAVTDIPEEPVLSEPEYAYIVDSAVSEDAFGSVSYLVQAVTETGEVKALKIMSKNVSVFDDSLKENKLNDNEVFENYLREYKGLVKIVLNESGEIAQVYFPGAESFGIDDTYKEDAVNKAGSYDKALCTYGTVSLSPETIIFNIDTLEEYLEDAVTAATVGDIFTDGSCYSFVAYGKQNGAAEVLVSYDARKAIDPEAPVMVVTRVSTAILDDELTTKITGIMNGETVSVTVDIDEPDCAELAYTLQKGNVIMFAGSDIVRNVTVLLDTNEDGIERAKLSVGEIKNMIIGSGAYENAAEYNAAIYFNQIVENKPYYFKLGDENYDAALDDTVEFITVDNCRYTLVEYSANRVTITAGDRTDLKKTTEPCPVYAFVKTAKNAIDEVTDIVVFKGIEQLHP